MERDEIGIDAPGADEVGVIPWPLLFREKVRGHVESSDRFRWYVLWTVLAGLFSVGFTITILAVSLPTIAEDLHSNTATLTWVITGPLLAFGIVGPILGKAGDVWGHKRVFCLGLAGSIVFAACSAMAPNAWLLIAFRVLGVGEGAATGPASMAMIMRVFPEGERVKAMGYWSLVGAGAPVLGVVAGGPIVEHFSWRLIFAAQVPFTMVALLLAVVILPKSETRDREAIDAAGAVTLGIGVTALLFALNRGPVWGWTSPPVIAGFLLCPVGLAAFVGAERRAAFPLLPLEYFRRRNFSFTIAVQFFSNFAYMGSFILTPLFLKEAFHFGETKIGLLSISRPLSFSITAPLAGYVAVRVGERTAAVTGTVLVVGSMIAWWTVQPGTSELHIVGSLALAGIGLGVASPSMVAALANSVDEANLGIAGAAQQMVTQVGVVAGIQIAQTFQAARRSSVGLVPSYQQAYLLAGAICVIGVVCAAFVRSTPREQMEGRTPLILEGFGT